MQFPLLDTTNWLKFQMPSTYWTEGSGVQGHVIQDMCAEGGEMGHFTWKDGLASKSAELASLPWARCVLAADVCGRPAGVHDTHATSKACRKFGCQCDGGRSPSTTHVAIAGVDEPAQADGRVTLQRVVCHSAVISVR
jgi:hypothetical protein